MIRMRIFWPASVARPSRRSCRGRIKVDLADSAARAAMLPDALGISNEQRRSRHSPSRSQSPVRRLISPPASEMRQATTVIVGSKGGAEVAVFSFQRTGSSPSSSPHLQGQPGKVIPVLRVVRARDCPRPTSPCHGLLRSFCGRGSSASRQIHGVPGRTGIKQLVNVQIGTQIVHLHGIRQLV
jgi:hypothetical protein